MFVWKVMNVVTALHIRLLGGLQRNTIVALSVSFVETPGYEVHSLLVPSHTNSQLLPQEKES